MFSGGDDAEVARWLLLFANSHAKRESPRIEAVLDRGDPAHAHYALSLRERDRVSRALVLDPAEVAANRGGLTWCATLASELRALARELLETHPTGNRAVS